MLIIYTVRRKVRLLVFLWRIWGEPRWRQNRNTRRLPREKTG